MSTFIARDIKSLQNYLNKSEIKDKKIGLVPTMGALHKGHISLVKKSKRISDFTIVSIFINPTQFSCYEDFKSYPQTQTEDIKKLKKEKVDMIFIPDKKQIYPKEFSTHIFLKKFDNMLCSKKRKNHFAGVANIIVKLFNLCKPNYAFFGEKDYQQLLIIKKLVADFNIDVKIHSIKTIRDENGLALSSRNKLLDNKQYKIAGNINKIINNELKFKKPLAKNYIKSIKRKLILKGISKIEYLEIRTARNLRLIKDNEEIANKQCRIFIAVYLGKVRLIDNFKI